MDDDFRFLSDAEDGEVADQVQEEPKYEVQLITARRRINGVVQLRCRYVDYPPEDDGWVSLENCDTPALIDDYHMRIHERDHRRMVELQRQLTEADLALKQLQLLLPSRRTTRAVSSILQRQGQAARSASLPAQPQQQQQIQQIQQQQQQIQQVQQQQQMQRQQQQKQQGQAQEQQQPVKQEKEQEDEQQQEDIEQIYVNGEQPQQQHMEQIQQQQQAKQEIDQMQQQQQQQLQTGRRETNKNEKLRPSQRKYVCTICNAVISRAYNLRLHMLRKHPLPDASSFQCEYCKFQFTTLQTLKTHLKRGNCLK